MDHPKDKGDRSTLAIMLALQSAGYAVLLPFGENTRYDLVIDDGEVLERVQCKTGRLRAGTVRFATTSTYGHHRNPATARRNYKGQVDYFAVYCPDNGGVYLIPADELPNESAAWLRIDPPGTTSSNVFASRATTRSRRCHAWTPPECHRGGDSSR